MFEATILLTLSLAIFDLVSSIIIALSIEALMLVFKFAITDPNKLIYSLYIMIGVSALLLTLAIYIKFTKLRIDEQ